MPSKKNKKQSNKTMIERRHERNPVMYYLTFVLLGLVIIAFVISPALSKMAESKKLIFGRYKGRNIEYYYDSDLYNSYYNLKSRYGKIYERLLNDPNKSEIEKKLLSDHVVRQAMKDAFEETVINMAILIRTDNEGLVITKSRLLNRIKELGLFATRGGMSEKEMFDEDEYMNTPLSRRKKIERDVENSIKREQYFSDLTGNIKFSSKEADFFANMGQKERSFNFVVFSSEDFPDKEVVMYGKKNKGLFSSIGLSSITLKANKGDAIAVLTQITEAPSSFDKIAKEKSEDEYSTIGGRMGTVSFLELKKLLEKDEDADSVLNLKKNELSTVIKKKDGRWVIYRCDAPLKEPDFNDEVVIATVREYLGEEDPNFITDYLQKIAENFHKKALKGGFVETAESMSVKIRTTDFFPINYGNCHYLTPVKSDDNHEALTQAADMDDFFSIGFSLQKGEFSKPIHISSDYVMLLQLREKREADRETLDKLRNNYPDLLYSSLQSRISDLILDSKDFKSNFDRMSKYFFSKPAK